MFDVRLSEPAWLLIAALAVPTVWLGLRWLLSMSGSRRISVVVLRTLLLVLLALSLAGASSPRTTDAVAVMAVIDVSDSVVSNAPHASTSGGESITFIDRVRQALAAGVSARQPDDRLGLLLFDRVAAIAAMPTRADPTDRALEAQYAEGTDIAQALRLAAAALPADATGRLVLVSDGNQTSGDALEAARSLIKPDGSRIAVDVLPVRYQIQREVLIERVDVPPTAISESTITVRIVLDATAPARGMLSLLYDGEVVDINGSQPGLSRPLSLLPGRRVEIAEVELDPRRVHRFEAVWEPELTEEVPGEPRRAADDTMLQNNRARAFTMTPGTGSVLVVSSSASASPLTGVLRDAGLRVERVVPAEAPPDVLSWQGHDLVMLEDIARDEIPDTSLSALAAAVTEFGTGLVMIGGYNSFGAGGWRGSPIEPVLPVLLEVPDRLVMPRVALMLVLDSSGSMGQSVLGSARSQQQIANEAAARAVTSLGPTDLVGVIQFSNSSSLVVPLAPNDEPEETEQRILSIRHGGGTNLLPALQQARNVLQNADADIKHVVVLSDGRSQNEEQLPALAERMLDDGITVTTISVGDEADTDTLRKIALRGKGSFYEVIDPNRLPSVFLSAVRVVRSPMIREGDFVPVRTAASSLVEALPPRIPPLGGLVLTSLRDEPGIVTSLMTDDDMPVLAQWQAGLGRVAAFTSGTNVWAEPWIESPAFSAFWTRLARSLGRPDDERRFTMRSRLEGDTMRLSLEAYQPDGSPTDGLDVPVIVFTPQGDQIRSRFTQTAPGLYEARVPATESGDYIAIARPTLNGAALPAALGGLSRPAGAEHRSLRSNDALLEEIAQLTGGRVLEPTAEAGQSLFTYDPRPVRRAWIPLWQPLVVLTLIVLLLDIATRRVAWDRWFSREFADEFRAQAAEAARDRSSAARLAAERLRQKAAERARPVPAGSDDDERAAELVRQAQRTRSQTPVRQESPAPIKTARPAAPEPSAPPEPQGEGSSASGLLAAKRRARQQMEDNQA